MKISWVFIIVILLGITCITQQQDENEGVVDMGNQEFIHHETVPQKEENEGQQDTYEGIEAEAKTNNEESQSIEGNEAPIINEGSNANINENKQEEEVYSPPPPYLAHSNNAENKYNHFEPAYDSNQGSQKVEEVPTSHSIGGENTYNQNNQNYNGYQNDGHQDASHHYDQQNYYNQQNYYENNNQHHQDQNHYDSYYHNSQSGDSNYYQNSNQENAGGQGSYYNNDQQAELNNHRNLNENSISNSQYNSNSNDANTLQDDQTMNDSINKSGIQNSKQLIEGAEITQLGPNNEVPKPVGFIAELETVSLIFKYEKVIETVKQFISGGAKTLEKEYGVPFPFNYIIVITGSIISIYVSNLLRGYLCRKKKEPTHVFNTVDHIDISKITRLLENLQKNNNQTQVATIDSSVSMSSHKSLAIDQSKEIEELKSQAKEITELKSQVASLQAEIKLMREQEDKSFKMLESIATSQNDLESNVYKSLIKIYDKITKTDRLSNSTKERDASPISFKLRSNPS